MPHTHLVVNKLNNDIEINGIVYFIPEGDYGITELITVIETTLPVGVTYNRLTYKLTLTSTSLFIVSGGLCAVLGIESGSSGISISSLGTVLLTGPQSIYLETDELSENLDQGDNRTLARIPITCRTGEVIHFAVNDSEYTGTMISNSCLDRLRFYLITEGEKPYLATASYCLTLNVKQIYTGRTEMNYVRSDSLFVSPDEILSLQQEIENDIPRTLS